MVAKNASNRHRTSSSSSNMENQVEAYKNPTDLFQWINFGRWNKAIKRTKTSPQEACIWIFSVNESTGKKKWKYLPIHMVCLQPNPPLSMIEALIEAYPKGAKCRDLDGNLPIHYLCAEACTDKQVLECVINVHEECLHEKDKYGRTPIQIVQQEFEKRKVDPAMRDSIMDYLYWKKSNAIKRVPSEDGRDDRYLDIRHTDSTLSARREEAAQHHHHHTVPKEYSEDLVKIHKKTKQNVKFPKNVDNNLNENTFLKILKHKEHDLRDAQDQLKISQLQLKEALEERNSLREQIETVLKESRSSRKLIMSLTDEIDKVRKSSDEELAKNLDMNAQLQATISQLQFEISKNQSDNSALKSELNGTTSLLSAETNRHTEVESKLSSVMQENESLKARIQSLSDENFQQLQKLDEHKVVDMEVTSLREQLKQLRDESIKIKQDHNRCDEKARTEIEDIKLDHHRALDDQKAQFVKKMEEQKANFQAKIESHKTLLQKKFDELKAAYTKKITEQKNQHRTQMDEIKRTSDEQITTIKQNLDEVKESYEKKIDEIKKDNGVKIDGLTAQMWKTEEHKLENQRKIDEMKRLYQSKLNELRYEHTKKVEEQRSSFQQRFLEQKNELRKVNDELNLTTKEVETLREKGMELTEENFVLRRRIDEQEIDFDKKLMTVRKAVAIQADAFATIQQAAHGDDISTVDGGKSVMSSSTNHHDNSHTQLAALDSFIAASAKLIPKETTPDIENTKTKVITLTTEKHALELEQVKLKKKINILENQNKSLEHKCQEFSNKYNEAIRSLEDFKEHENNLHSKDEERLRSIMSQRDDLQIEVNILSEKNRKNKEEIANLEDARDKERSEREKSVREINEKFTSAQSKISELRDMVTKNKSAYQEKIDDMASRFDQMKKENNSLIESVRRQKESDQDNLVTIQSLRNEKVEQEQKVEELQIIINDLQSENEGLIRRQQQMKASLAKLDKGYSSSPPIFRGDNVAFEKKLQDLIFENEQHLQTITQQQDLITSLSEKITSYQKKIKLLAMDKHSGRQSIVDDLSAKITNLASSLLHLSNLQNRIVQSSVQTEQLYLKAAKEERELLLNTITNEEKELDASNQKRFTVMKAMSKQEEDIGVASSKERERILNEIYLKEEERKHKVAKDREVILKAVLKLQKEIELVSSEVAML